jgi:uncharacterized protein (DUF433 family)
MTPRHTATLERVIRTKKTDGRFDTPLYTVGEAAAYLRVPRTTFETWAHGYTRKRQGRGPTKAGPIITSFPAGRRVPEVPFIGLAEGMVLAAFRSSGVPMQRIRPAIEVLQRELDLDHALGSKRLYTDGAEILFDYANKEDEEQLRGLTVVRTRQRVFAPVIQEYLRRITYAPDGWARRLKLPISKNVIVDPDRAFGQPIFEKGAVRVEDVLDRFEAGDSLGDVAYDFDVPVEDIEEVVRVALKTAA